MSEPIPESGGGGPAAPSFMSKKFMGIPAIVWLIGAVLLAYLYFRRGSGGASSSGGGGTSTTGDISIAPATTTLNVKGQYGPFTQSSTQTLTQSRQSPPRHRTPNPQPKPKVKHPVRKHVTSSPPERED